MITFALVVLALRALEVGVELLELRVSQALLAQDLERTYHGS